ncbi:hypothetical protein ABHF33_13900 [Chitinibacter sp. FCG-7]|uniref:Uncharacterized protein n=1 Tax=Chitinibacter mangrovi TaxID=3153927 RepID=A0AAU7F8B2_9NEIS
MVSIRVNTLQHIYSKTPLGQQAIASRSIPMLASERRVLILIDGERNIAELYQQLNHHDVLALVDQLQAKGLIRRIGGEDASPLVISAATPSQPSPAPSATRLPVPTPPPPALGQSAAIALDEATLHAVKSLMISSSQQGLGLMAARLVREIEDIRDAQTLKATMARWNMALRESRSAAAQADQLLQTAKALLPMAA